MPYPKPVAIPGKRAAARHADVMKSIQSRLRRVETRTMCIDSGLPLNNLPGVVASFTGGNLLVYVNGAATATGPYQYLASYAPTAGDNVLLVPCTATYSWIVLGVLAG